MLTQSYRVRFVVSLLIIVVSAFGCSKLKDLTGKSDRLYFCERYDTAKGEINEAEKFTTGSLTVMVKLTKPIGVKDVKINITDKTTNTVVETKPFSVSADMDYIFFDGVNFEKPGKYKVSCLKEDGTVVVSGEVEITGGK